MQARADVSAMVRSTYSAVTWSLRGLVAERAVPSRSFEHPDHGSPRLARDGGCRGRAGVARTALCWFALASVNAARADTVASCGGFAMLGGAQINCSHVQPTAPAQVCTFSWALMTTGNTLSTVQGSFLLPPGANNMTVYQGSGFNAALSNPIVLCQGRKSR
jgi:hypothetical protein